MDVGAPLFCDPSHSHSKPGRGTLMKVTPLYGVKGRQISRHAVSILTIGEHFSG
jgi:hypothetical protein